MLRLPKTIVLVNSAGRQHDWFHIATRLQHLKQITSALSTDDPARVPAKAVIVAEVERLHWRLWNGKAKNARISIDQIRAVMPHFQGEPGERKSTAPARKLWTALHALDGYLTGQTWVRGPGAHAARVVTDNHLNSLVFGIERLAKHSKILDTRVWHRQVGREQAWSEPGWSAKRA